MPCASNSVRKPLALPSALGLGDAEEQLRNARPEPRGLDGVEGCQRLHQGLGRAAGLGDHHEAHRVQVVERTERRLQRVAVEIVVEARARALALGLVGDAGNMPAAELRQRLPAEAGAAGAEEDHRPGAPAQRGERRLGGVDVGALLGDAQVREAARLIIVLQARQRRRQAIKPRRQFGRRQAVTPDGAFKTAGDRLPVDGLAHARAGIVCHGNEA